jgi:hypothetical protein
VFAAPHDRFDGPTDQRAVFDHPIQVRKYRAETGDDPAGEHTVKGLSGTEDRVPFRHGTP